MFYYPCRKYSPCRIESDQASSWARQDADRSKRLVELVTEGGGHLAVILAEHPKLRDDLKRPQMQEIGDRTTVFEFGGLRDRQRDYIDWRCAPTSRPSSSRKGC